MIIKIDTTNKVIEISGDIEMAELQEIAKIYPDYKMKSMVTEVITERINYPYQPFIPWSQPYVPNTPQPYSPWFGTLPVTTSTASA